MSVILMIGFFLMLAAVMIPMAGFAFSFSTVGAGLLFVILGFTALYQTYRLIEEDN